MPRINGVTVRFKDGTTKRLWVSFPFANLYKLCETYSCMVSRLASDWSCHAGGIVEYTELTLDLRHFEKPRATVWNEWGEPGHERCGSDELDEPQTVNLTDPGRRLTALRQAQAELKAEYQCTTDTLQNIRLLTEVTLLSILIQHVEQTANLTTDNGIAAELAKHEAWLKEHKQ